MEFWRALNEEIEKKDRRSVHPCSSVR